MELVGLEPATSWVQSSRPLTPKCPFTALYGRAPVVAQHLPQQPAPRLAEAPQILNRSAGAIEEQRGRASTERESVDLSRVRHRHDRELPLVPLEGGRGSPRRCRNRLSARRKARAQASEPPPAPASLRASRKADSRRARSEPSPRGPERSAKGSGNDALRP